jgi:hypothetical protein
VVDAAEPAGYGNLKTGQQYQAVKDCAEYKHRVDKCDKQAQDPSRGSPKSKPSKSPSERT